MSAQLVTELTILMLAIFLGFEVISKVPTLLHTPLMSGTNAIHGIVIVGAIIVAGIPGQPIWLRIVTLTAVALATGNVVALLTHLAPEGELELDFEDEITAGACVTRKETA